MNVALVIHYSWPLVGGLEKISLRIAQHLQNRGHSCRIITRYTRKRHPMALFFCESEPEITFRSENVETTVLGFGRPIRLFWTPLFRLIWRPCTLPLARKMHNFIMVPKLVKACRQANLIHFFGNGPELLGFSAASASQKLGIPFIVEPALHEGQWGDSWIDLELYREADLILAHTNHEKKVLIRMGIPEQKIQVVVHGADLVAKGNGERFRKSYGIQGPMILFLGRKTAGKGATRTQDAFALVRQEFPEAVLVLAGPKEGKKIAPLSSGTLDLDDLTEEEKQDALAACDVFCLPSEGESFGMVYLEAWACGKPVVALDLPSLEHIRAHQGGILSAPDKIASALCSLLKDKQLCREMGKRGRLGAAEHSWEKSIETYLQAYRSLSPQ